MARIEQRWSLGTVPTSEVSNGFWIFEPLLEFADAPDLQGLLGQFLLDPLNDLLSLLPSDVSPTVSRLTRYGSEPLTISLPSPVGSGAGARSSPVNAALVLSWRSLVGGPKARSTTWLPLPLDAYDDSGEMINAAAYGSAQGTCNAFLNHMNALAYGIVPPVTFSTLHLRSTAPGPVAIDHSPIVWGAPSRWVGTLDRRIRSRGRAPSR
jgi:hypothetical protein